MKHTDLLFSILLVPGAVCVTSLAHAGAPPVFVVSDKTSSDRADELVRRGLALGDKDRYAEAEPLLREAWGLKHSYDIAANLGIVETALGKWRDAAEHLTFALKSFPANGKAEHRKVAEMTLSKALLQVTALTIKANVDRAEISIDGRSIGISPVADVVFVDAGSHVVTATLAGYQMARATVEARKGTAQDIDLALVKAPEPPPVESKSGARTGVFVGGLVLGGAALVTGITATVISNGKSSDAASQRTELSNLGGEAACLKASLKSRCEAMNSSYIAQSSAKNVAITGYVLGAAALGGAGLAYLLWPTSRHRDTTAVRVVPAVGAREQGIVVVGSF